MAADDSKLAQMADLLRLRSVEATTKAGSGHPSSCASMAEIIAVLFFDEMCIGANNPSSPLNDRFVLSKGHAAPILYAAWAEAGLYPVEHLLSLRKIDSDLEGHPTRLLPFVDVATGSLGQGLGAAAGMAWVGKYLDKLSYRVYCVLGDGECAEGSVWEAMNFAAHYKLDNLVAIIDVNRLGQSECTMFGHDMDSYLAKVQAFGCHGIVVDGHSIKDLKKAFAEARATKGKTTVILAKTFKGKGLKDVENLDGWHGRALKPAEAQPVLADLRSRIKISDGELPTRGPESVLEGMDDKRCSASCQPEYKIGEMVATRLAYGVALAKLGKCNDRVIALDGDTKNSTFSIKFRDAYPDRFIECYIAEQNMVSVAVGASCRNRSIPFASAFACFLTRAHDQIRMAAISQANVKFCGSHSGISIGEDGSSQMGLEDLAMFRCIPGSTVFYPSDAVATARAVELAAQTKGICYIRTGRPNVPVIYKNDERFEVGKAKVVVQSPQDVCTVVAAGITLVQAMKAAEAMRQCGKSIRVIDPFTVKPIDGETIISNAKQTRGRILVVEDHYPEGGIGEAVMDAVSEQPDIVTYRLAVERVPRSGPPDELLHMFGIDAEAIKAKIEKICS